MNKILNFIFSKKDEGIYRTYKILGIKIITKPIELKLNMIENNIINQVNNQIEKIYFYPFIDKYIDIQKDKYDYVISFESIEHIQNDIQFIETIISAIKNNGYWFLSIPNEEVMYLKKNNNKFYFRHYTNKMIGNIFKKYNLEVIEQYGEDTYSINENGLITGTLS